MVQTGYGDLLAECLSRSSGTFTNWTQDVLEACGRDPVRMFLGSELLSWCIVLVHHHWIGVIDMAFWWFAGDNRLKVIEFRLFLLCPLVDCGNFLSELVKRTRLRPWMDLAAEGT